MEEKASEFVTGGAKYFGEGLCEWNGLGVLTQRQEGTKESESKKSKYTTENDYWR